MSPKDVILRYYAEVWDGRRPEVIGSLFAASYVNHAGSRGTLGGPAGIRANYDSTLAAFPDVRFRLDEVLAEGNKVVARYTMLGRHDGPFQGTPATGRSIDVPGIGIYSVADGMIQESWVLRDTLALLRQIGAA